MADTDGAAVRVDPLVVEVDLQLLQTAQHLAGEGFVDFDHVHGRQGQTGALQDFLYGRYRANAHYPGFDPGNSAGEDARAGGQTELVADVFVAEQQRGGAVVNAGGIAGGHHATLEQRWQSSQFFQGSAGSGMFVGCYSGCRVLPPPCRDLYLQQFFVIKPGCSGCFVFLLGSGCERVTVCPADSEVPGQVVRGLRHGVVAVLSHERPVGKAPAEHGIVQLLVAVKAGFRLAQHPGRAAHALDAAGDEQLPLSATDGARRVQGCRGAAGAQAVDGDAADGGMHAGQQRGITRDIAAVFTRLIGVAEHHIFYQAAVDAVAVQQPLDNGRRQVIRAHRRQPAAVTAEGGTDAVVNY